MRACGETHAGHCENRTFEDESKAREERSDDGDTDCTLGVERPYVTGSSADELAVADGRSSTEAPHWGTLKSIVQAVVDTSDEYD